MRANNSKRLTVLSEAEKLALLSLPDFDDFQRAEYFTLIESELSLVLSRRDIPEQIYCLLQISYFKAKQTFFSFSFLDVPPEDIAFVLQRYFPGVTLEPRPVTHYEYYAQCNEIIGLVGFRLWLESDLSLFIDKAAKLARRDVTPMFILTELIAYLNTGKM